jgi:Rod binding domain-containing protein
MNSITAVASSSPAPYPLSVADSQTDANATAEAATAGNSSSSSGTQKVDAVATDFEAVFLTQMLSAMFSGDDMTSFFGGGSTGEIYKGYLMNEFGKAMAKSGGIGIAAQVKQELLSLQEVKS